MKKRIFTFWEPENKIPAYVALCMQTWKKFLPDYEIVILNYKNLHEYLDKKMIKAILSKKTSLPKQADCIRVAILNQYGGKWLDADTIITKSEFFDKLNNKDCVMIGEEGYAHLAFIDAPLPHNRFLSLWLKKIISHVKIYKITHRHSWRINLLKKYFKNYYDKIEGWGYFGNEIINPMITKGENKPVIIDRDNIGAFLEHLSSLNCDDITKPELYRKFYFSKASDVDWQRVLEKNQGIILLHNSWTPVEYKKMSQEAFLQSSCVLAEILKIIL